MARGSDQQTLLLTENFLLCHKWSPYKNRGADQGLLQPAKTARAFNVQSFIKYAPCRVYGHKQTNRNTHACLQCSHTSVGLARAYPNKLHVWSMNTISQEVLCNTNFVFATTKTCRSSFSGHPTISKTRDE